MSENNFADNQDIELQLLLNAIYLRHGYDFNDYSRAHIKRRILQMIDNLNIESISHLQHKILYDSYFFELLLKELSINVSEMFRDPLVYKYIRQEIIPVLKTYPSISLWVAGCAAGEEVYSLAILLYEEDLLEKTTIYATDFSLEMIEKAKQGIYSIENVKNYTKNYQQAGGNCSFSDYYQADYDSIIMSSALRKKIVFSQHNLVVDSSFATVHMITCRNVLIYFNKNLQNRVLCLLGKSLVGGGFLCLGAKESLRFSECAHYMQSLHDDFKIFKKKYL